MKAHILPADFYLQPTVEVARGLLGQLLVHEQPEGATAGIIVETEAYLVGDPGSHAWRGQTQRNAPMYAAPGTIYVYRIYGVHWCLNLVTQPAGVPEAVLIRALEPVAGLDLMRRRRGRESLRELCSGPGKLTQALDIDDRYDGGDITSPPLTVRRGPGDPAEITSGVRIGIHPDRGGRELLRFGLAGSRYLSRRFS
ncbi:MAG TPA: DNA-3-methyladenine glycosylase [Armatimonadota bacterium]|jgi:DNA-3-methyladenine glycosylase